MMDAKTLTKGEQTRARLLDIAEASVLSKGFAATSIDEVIAAAGITKSGFFYHFKDKNHLAKAMLERYLSDDDELFDDLLAKADALHEDPLHSFLIFLRMLAEVMGNLPRDFPGCLVAAYCYQDQLFSRDIRDMTGAGLLNWRARFRERLDRIAAVYPPRADVNLDDLADMLSAVADGGIILSRALRDTTMLPRQVLAYRTYVRLLFLGN